MSVYDMLQLTDETWATESAKHPDSYMGYWPGDDGLLRAGIGRSRDSDHLEVSNYEAAIKNLRAALESLEFEDPDAAVNRMTLEKIVQLTLDYLPENYSKALEWKYLEGLSVDEIAGRLGTGVVAAQSMLARARTAFRKGFREVQHELGDELGVIG